MNAPDRNLDAISYKHEAIELLKDTSLDINLLLHWAEYALQKAYGAVAISEIVAWYNNAILIYNHLDTTEQDSLSTSAIHARLNIAKAYGYHAYDSKPYIKEVIDWVEKGIPGDTENTKTKASHWQSLSINEIRALRHLKMRLKIVVQLKENGVHLNEDLLNLIPLIEQLP